MSAAPTYHGVGTADMRHLKAEIVRRGLRQIDVARRIGIDPTALNQILNGHRPPPKDFESRVLAALDLLEAAEQAAAEARERVLAEGRAA